MSSVVISGDTSGAITVAAPSVAGTNTITLPAATGTVALTSGSTFTNLTVTNDASISGLTVGKGTNSVTGNTALGYQSLYASNSGSGQNTSVGHQTLYSNTTGSGNSTIGYFGLVNNTTGNYNSSIGLGSLQTNTTGSNNTAIGYQSLLSNTTASNNTAVGYQAGYYNTTGSSVTAIGYQAGYANTTATDNTFIGKSAALWVTGGNNTAIGSGALAGVGGSSTGSSNTAVGYQAGFAKTTGDYNAFFGASAGGNATTGQYNVCLGWYAGISVFNITTESNRVVVGTSNVTNAYIQVAWTVTSDARDKTDVVDSAYGLDFVTKLRPVTYKWDKRDKYENKIPDGTHKESKTNIGFLAQDVIALEKEFGATDKDLLVADDEQDENLKITESKMIPVLVKAIQELNAKVEAQAAQIAALTGAK